MAGPWETGQLTRSLAQATKIADYTSQQDDCGKRSILSLTRGNG